MYVLFAEIQPQKIRIINLGGGFNGFYFHPYLGKWSNLTNIFQLGRNHQRVIYSNILYSTLLISTVGSLETFVAKQDVFDNGAYEVCGLGSQRCFIKSGRTLLYRKWCLVNDGSPYIPCEAFEFWTFHFQIEWFQAVLGAGVDQSCRKMSCRQIMTLMRKCQTWFRFFTRQFLSENMLGNCCRRSHSKDFKQINSRFDHTSAEPTIHVVHVGKENAFWKTNCKLLSPKCADSSVLEEGATARAGFWRGQCG